MKKRLTVTRRIEWDAAHRVMKHESKCATLHGHRYVALITVEAEVLDSVDRVVDFGVVKQLVGGWVDEHWDHTTILNAYDEQMIHAFKCAHGADNHRSLYLVPGEPTAEMLASLLLGFAQEILDAEAPVSSARLVVKRVRVHETPNCYADAEVVS